MSVRAVVTWAAVAALTSTSTAAFAYPTSTVFAPNAETLEAGALEVEVTRVGSRGPAGVRVDGSWVGARAGLLDRVEVGADAIVPTDVPERRRVVLDVKVALVEAGRGYPRVAAGIFQVSPSADASAGLVYVVADERLHLHGVPLGRLSAGLLRGDGRFRGGPPFRDTRWGMLAGWELPRVGDVTFGVDVVSGTSLVSGANVAIRYDASDDASAMIGVSLGTDRRPDVFQGDGFFFGVSLRLDTRGSRP